MERTCTKASVPCALLPVLWLLPHLILIKLYEMGFTILPIFQMRKKRHSKVKPLLDVI